MSASGLMPKSRDVLITDARGFVGPINHVSRGGCWGGPGHRLPFGDAHLGRAVQGLL